MFGVVGSGFAMFLAFVIFVVFSSYREAEGNAASEAVAVRQMFRTADLFEAADEAALRADLVCYARSVIGLEWEAMESQTDSDVVDLWLDGFERTLASANVAEPRAQIALGHWLAQTAIRQEGRRGRISEASPVIAPFVWVALFIIGFIVIGFMVLFADRREHVLVQGFMIVSVTTMVVAGLAVVAFLDRPYGDHGGSVEPEAMERTRVDGDDVERRWRRPRPLRRARRAARRRLRQQTAVLSSRAASSSWCNERGWLGRPCPTPRAERATSSIEERAGREQRGGR